MLLQSVDDRAAVWIATHRVAPLNDLFVWLGYLDKMAKADVFVVMDDLQYEAQNFQNRNRIKLNHGPCWLTVPLLRGAQTDRILDKRIDNTGRGDDHGALRAGAGAAAAGIAGAPPWPRVSQLELSSVNSPSGVSRR